MGYKGSVIMIVQYNSEKKNYKCKKNWM